MNMAARLNRLTPALSGKQRLNKLMPALSARERAILVLRSLKDNTPADPLWRRTMPQEQAREFSRLIVLMNACNIYLPLYITVVEQKTEQMNLRLTLIRTMAHFGSSLWHLGALVPTAKHKKAQQVVEGVFPVIELPWDGEEHE